MLDLALMLEGQNGLNWPRWQRLARAADDLGFAGLYRSDHYTNSQAPDLDSLELWVSLTWLASHTTRIEFGPLVSPVSFRQPTMTARMASAVDDLSGGRLILGLGAGWQEREHSHYSWDLLDVPRRFARFEEGLKIISHLLQHDSPLNFAGEFYHLKEAVLLPRPQRPAGPPLLIGGNGQHRTLPLVARYASEWNAVYINARKFDQLNAQLDDLLTQANRPLASVRRSLMTGLVFGKDDAEVQRKLNGRAVADLRARGLLVGTPSAIVEQLGGLAAVGVQRVMAQWLDLDDVDGVEVLAQGVLPQLK